MMSSFDLSTSYTNYANFYLDFELCGMYICCFFGSTQKKYYLCRVIFFI